MSISKKATKERLLDAARLFQPSQVSAMRSRDFARVCGFLVRVLPPLDPCGTEISVCLYYSGSKLPVIPTLTLTLTYICFRLNHRLFSASIRFGNWSSLSPMFSLSLWKTCQSNPT
ncbi:uncharacterized protein SPPG_08208 [Spizellomyces punctatus DAOM BR117]|uniref:Uncharacterized protein n=1 Tax=Spizellomyces punctatus (strain DAOM BR117) TaxID=645134 RepID=A0A0L0H508_SPIPD|nr:hypothetical protein, variant [Spizellomyces punctatus DAOM BR117]XP_016604342.1 uncharacterized protein SPPG_08208 [Spizellomyces punctatus DAOM BR117]KNC96301.1 hypothetical protein, variant [Spizellomyces punctatus DAOM BR117]KNC96302.1 hypothetical protein SPPG_08208 [Spizellomyces punctatus DAOM BR117]|eukprot:XP_016604341.1 hypothetical protein, variant [Spizellomyces punctatus DAOM BR117]